MAGIEYREYRPEDAESFLRLHDSVFPRLSSEFWQVWSRGPVTAAVALMDGEVVGAVPFHFRDFRVRPDAVVRVAFEYSVCVREDLRSKGVGSRLMATAKEFLRGRCHAMMVYRGDEQSPGYRFYARNGHHDLIYLRPWTYEGSSIAPPHMVGRQSYEEFLAREADALAVFASAYDTYGGYPARHPGYYGPAVNTTQYNEVPLDLTVLHVAGCTANEPSLRGYAIVGEEKLRPTLHLLEIAALGNDLSIALPLLSAFASMAGESDEALPASALLPDSSPYVPVLRALGFRQTPRAQSAMMVMAYLLDPEGMARTLWRENEAAASMTVMAWTPRRQLVLHRAAEGNGKEIILEMKEDALTRLLFGRLDLRSAVHQERVTAVGAEPSDIEAIAQALPFTPWAYHHLDYI